MLVGTRIQVAFVALVMMFIGKRHDGVCDAVSVHQETLRESLDSFS